MICIKAHFDLFFVILFGSEFRKAVFTEITEFGGFYVAFELSACHGAKHKYFTYAIRVYRKIMLCPILNCNDFVSRYI